MSDESGKPEVYVRDFPGGARKWQISGEGGAAPHWRGDGREIFYAAFNKLMAAKVATSPSFSAGTPTLLFEKRALNTAQYEVSGDGQRVILLDWPANAKPLSIHVAYNWFEEFRGQAGRI